MSLRIGLLGASGRMGRMVEVEAEAAGHTIVARRGRSDLGEGFGDAEVVIDFSAPEALRAALPLLPPRAALVSGTTGLSDDDHARLSDAARTRPVLWAANFSTGVAVLTELVARAAALLRDYDLEIVEVHHGRKKDAPSGTALALARAAADARALELAAHLCNGRSGLVGARPADEIGVHAVRAGDTVGDHTVWLAGTGERLELRHVATSRAAFAAGAVRAAQRVVGLEPGMYAISSLFSARDPR